MNVNCVKLAHSRCLFSLYFPENVLCGYPSPQRSGNCSSPQLDWGIHENGHHHDYVAVCARRQAQCSEAERKSLRHQQLHTKFSREQFITSVNRRHKYDVSCHDDNAGDLLAVMHTKLVYAPNRSKSAYCRLLLALQA